MSKYLEERRALKLKAPHGKEESKAQRIEDKKMTAKWFGAQSMHAPSTCENCGRSLQATINFHPRAHICHVVAKTKVGGCPSVATHPQNRWFGCLDCHNGYDQMMAEAEFHNVVQMKVWPEIVKRFLQVLPHIKESELKNVPQVLLDAAKKATKKK